MISKRPDGMGLFEDCLIIWLVSDFCIRTLILVGARAKRWWRLLLLIKPLHASNLDCGQGSLCLHTVCLLKQVQVFVLLPEFCTHEVGLPAHCELKKVELTRVVDHQVRSQIHQ